MDSKKVKVNSEQAQPSLNGISEHQKAHIERREKVNYFKKLVILIALILIALLLLIFAVYLISNKYLN